VNTLISEDRRSDADTCSTGSNSRKCGSPLSPPIKPTT